MQQTGHDGEGLPAFDRQDNQGKQQRRSLLRTEGHCTLIYPAGNKVLRPSQLLKNTFFLCPPKHFPVRQVEERWKRVSSATGCDIGHFQGLIGLKLAGNRDLPAWLRHSAQLLGNAVRRVNLQLWRWPRKDPLLRRVTNGVHLHNHLFLPL